MFETVYSIDETDNSGAKSKISITILMGFEASILNCCIWKKKPRSIRTENLIAHRLQQWHFSKNQNEWVSHALPFFKCAIAAAGEWLP